MSVMKPRPGKVAAPSKDPWLWRNLFRKKAQSKFVGEDGSMTELKSPEGQAKISAATAETSEALGYSLEEAEKSDALEDLYMDLQHSKPLPAKGEDEMSCCDPEGLV